MAELAAFYNNGFGWICRHCESEIGAITDASQQSRLMREGESESKLPDLSTIALAKWADAAQRILECPRCGMTESAEDSERR